MPFPPDVSPHGHLIDDLFVWANWFIFPTFAIVVALLVYCLIAFRDRPGHRAQYIKGDTRRSTMLTLIFSVVVFLLLDVNLAVYDFEAFEGVFGHMPDEEEALVIDVRGQQFEWRFRYAGDDGVFGTAGTAEIIKDENPFGLADDDEAAQDDIQYLGEVAVPVNTPVIFKLTSNDVLHSFFLPYSRVKMDVLPGLPTYTYTTFTEVGEFPIACAELCGANHYTMQAKVRAMEQADYEAWIEDRKAEMEEDAYEDY